MKHVKLFGQSVCIQDLAYELQDQLKEKEMVSFMDMLGHNGDWSLEEEYIKKLLKTIQER